MEFYYFVYLFALAVGIVSAGFTGSLWAVTAGEFPRPSHLARADAATPLKLIALIVSAPVILLRHGLWYLDFNPVLALVLLGLGLGWSFLQGVFILTTFFAFT